MMEAPLFFFAGFAAVVLPCLLAVWITGWR